MTLCLETSRWGSVGTQVKKNFIVAMLQGEISRGRGSQVDFFFFFFCLCYDVGARKRDNRCRNIGSHTFFMVP